MKTLYYCYYYYNLYIIPLYITGRQGETLM